MIEIEIIEPKAPKFFVKDLAIVQLTAGEAKEWQLPEVDESLAKLVEILVAPDANLQSYIGFQASTRTVTFNNKASSAQLAGKLSKIVITLVGTQGQETSYT